MLTASHDAPELLDSSEGVTAAVQDNSGSLSFHSTSARGRCLEYQLRIEGTAVVYDPHTGLPSRLEGNIYYASGSRDGQYAGTYREDIVPLLHEQYGLVGATGTGVFTFKHSPSGGAHASLEVTYRAYITGFEEGALLVSSQGSVVDGSKMMRDVEGGFVTSSRVVFGPTFSMAVNVNLHLCRTPGPDGSSPTGPAKHELASTSQQAPAPVTVQSGLSAKATSVSVGSVVKSVAKEAGRVDASSIAANLATARSNTNSYTASVDQLFASWSKPNAKQSLLSAVALV